MAIIWKGSSMIRGACSLCLGAAIWRSERGLQKYATSFQREDYWKCYRSLCAIFCLARCRAYGNLRANCNTALLHCIGATSCSTSVSRSSLFTGFHLQNSSSFHSIKPVPATEIGCPMAAACLTAFKLLSICRSSFNFLQTQYRRTLVFLSQSSPAPLLVSVPGISFLTSNLSLFAIYIHLWILLVITRTSAEGPAPYNNSTNPGTSLPRSTDTSRASDIAATRGQR